MDTAITDARKTQAADALLQRLALGEDPTPRPSAKLRLEEAIGPELARRLLASLTVSRGR